MNAIKSAVNTAHCIFCKVVKRREGRLREEWREGGGCEQRKGEWKRQRFSSNEYLVGVLPVS